MPNAVLSLARRHRAYVATHPTPTFAVRFPAGEPMTFGDGEPEFTIVEAGEKALASLDQLQIAVAYMDGHLDVDGDMQSALSMRALFNDFHPLTWLSKFVPGLLGLGHRQDRRSIAAHYDRDPEFFLTFLDTRHRCYTQGAFESDDEELEPAMTRKMDIALRSLGIGPGDHVLDVGGGWGAFLEYAGKQGIHVTSLTLSQESETYLNDLVDREGLPALSTRRLGDELGCEAMSIYHHFPSKAHLMDALLDRFLSSVPIPAADAPWQDRLRGLVAGMRQAAINRPEFFRYAGLHRLNTEGGLKMLNALLAIYFDAGFDTEGAARHFRLTSYYVIGGILDETSGYAKGPSAVNPPSDEVVARDFPYVAKVGPYFQKGAYEKTFDIGFELLIAGFEQALVAQGKRRAKG
jgi:AcrR family transcriptional regulator